MTFTRFHIDDVPDKITQKQLQQLYEREDTQFLFSLFPPKTLRIVAGIVRDCFLHHPQNDIDFATTLLPDEVINLAHQAGLKTRLHGKSHGTIMVIYNHIGYEITTLRQDITSDGRHAEVVFTKDYAQDAMRRDFTINALFLDEAGFIYDYVGAIKDIADKKLDFIGDASQRVQEDYLRILRLYRFMSQTAFTPTKTALTASYDHKKGLHHISKERIGAEMLKLLRGQNYYDSMQEMIKNGVSEIILPPPLSPDLTRLYHLKRKETDDCHDPLIRLFALYIHKESDIALLKEALKLTNHQSDFLHMMWKGEQWLFTQCDEYKKECDIITSLWSQLAYYYSKDVANALLLLHDSIHDITALHQHIKESQHWRKPSFPLKAKALLKEGYEKGPALGEELKRREFLWVKNGFIENIVS